MAAALAVFESFLPGCIPDQAGLFGVGTSQTDPSIAYIPYIPFLAGPDTVRLWTGHYKPGPHLPKPTVFTVLERPPTSTACGSLRRPPGRKIFAPACEKCLRTNEIAPFCENEAISLVLSHFFHIRPCPALQTQKCSEPTK